MKRCPQCYGMYGDRERFCEIDGHELLAEPTLAPEVRTTAAPARPVWVPAAALGVLVGLAIGIAIFAAVSLSSEPAKYESQTIRETSQVQEKTLPHRIATASEAPIPELAASPSPADTTDAEEEAEAEPFPATSAESHSTAAQLNRGPISTGQKTKAGESEAEFQTVIEMSDGSTLEVDAAWEDKQGIWYRRSGLVSFVESSRVKAVTTRKGAKAEER